MSFGGLRLKQMMLRLERSGQGKVAKADCELEGGSM